LSEYDSHPPKRPSTPIHQPNMKKLLLLLCLFSTTLWAQEKQGLKIEFNGIADLEYLGGSSNSNYFINGLPAQWHTGVIRPLELNLMSKVQFNEQWSLHLRGQMERSNGRAFEEIRLAQAMLQFRPKDSKWQFAIGRFVAPTGLFSQKQLSTARNLIDVPIAYGYFVNASDELGYVPQLGNVTRIRTTEVPEWGLPLLYYNGYANGLKSTWAIKPGKISLDFALTTGAPNQQQNLHLSPLNLGLQSRLKWQVAYFWKQGFSFSRGSFFRRNFFNEGHEPNNAWQQTVLATDYTLGIGHFEFSGELIGAFYRVPQYLPLRDLTQRGTFSQNDLSLSAFSAYLDAKYEFPFLTGAYVISRVETLNFGQIEGTDTPWDQTVQRLSLGLGYKFKNTFLLRSSYAWQTVNPENPVNFQAWRTALSVFF
jgi:hypothetical protein